ncbi:2-dehydro-3-deoxygluconokinase [Streptomyces sp. 2112.3]|uniref:sugar kinase n=1 Tax=Streptomyces sp. 2112.3 TaxID=1881023 RepID=UPI00089AA8C7|nr:2-dehydro-3-deoxygluconokinase [Streptomyces sp. 2112.3]
MTGQSAAGGGETQRDGDDHGDGQEGGDGDPQRCGGADARPGTTAPGRPRAPRQPGRPDVFTFGETMVALRGSGPLKLGGTMQVSIAGAESNVAIGLARLGHEVHWAGAVGEDEAGELVLRTLRAEGVEVSGASADPGAPTGLLLFEPRLPDVTRVHYYRAGSAGSRLTADGIERAFRAAPPRILHLTGITPALSSTARSAALHSLRLAREYGSSVCLDVNFRARLWTAEEAAAVLGEWLPSVDLLIASDDELLLCLPPRDAGGGSAAGIASQAGRLRELGVGEIVVTLGAEGAMAFTHDGSLHRSAKAVRAVDSVGAGDAFAAGYLSALLDGDGPAACLERAVTTGAFAVASPGDWEGAPTRAELGMLGAPPGTVVR